VALGLALTTLAGRPASALAPPLAGAEPEARPRPAPPGYPHASFRAERLGRGARSYWLFEPAEPAPERAPVVVFCHGWLAMNPGVYGAWIEHLARRGFVVVFPRYQADWTTKPADFLPNAVGAVRDALDVLETAPGRVRPDRSRFALMGHSAGGNLVALMAAVAAAEALPPARAVVAIMPGEVLPVESPRPADIPAETHLVVVAGDQDLVVGDGRARTIFAEAAAVPPERKAFVLYRTDRRGPVPMIADHLAPTGALRRLDSGEGPFRSFQFGHAEVDLLDRFGFWRLADLTLEAAFAGLPLDREALADLGRWSDGREVLAPIVGDDLEAIPAVFLTHGARLIPWQPVDFVRTMTRDPQPAADQPAAVTARVPSETKRP